MLPEKDNERQAKLVLLGSMGAGKTSLTRRIVDNVFDPNYEVTVAVSYRVVQPVLSGKTVTLQIWDTGGMERYSSIGPIYYRGSHAALFVYDVTDPSSWADLPIWHRNFTEVMGDAFFGAVVANKIDLSPEIDTTEMEEWAKERDLAFFRVSAKTGEKVTHLFDMATQGAFLIRNSKVFEGSPPPHIRTRQKCC
jgi:Ras-related protein Rab-5C